MTTLPGIIKQRWAAAAENPSIQQWRSLAVWIEDFADACEKHVETQHLVSGMRRMAAEAWDNMRSLQPVREADEVAA